MGEAATLINFDLPDVDEQYEKQLADELGALASEPYAAVLWMFDWGEGELARFDGPDEWQSEFLLDLGDEIKARAFSGDPVDPVMQAAASGHGVGKSALVAMLILFLMATRPNARGVVTASTAPQLRTKTIPELAKWLKRCRVGHWFELRTGQQATLFRRGSEQAWRTDFITCRKENSEAFAGLHAVDSSPFYIFDESSGVPDIIFEVAEGGLTDGEPFWFQFGNRTRAIGRFAECWGRFEHRWLTYCVDSREAKVTNKRLLARWIKDYGIDSDFCRVRILGLPPKASSSQFISVSRVEDARKREVQVGIDEPLIMGVDIARHGGDWSVVRYRKGRDARVIEPFREEYTENLMHFAELIADAIKRYGVDACFVDGGGLGIGVVDRLHQMGFNDIVHEVVFGGRPARREYFNKRSEMWGRLRSWLEHGAIDDHPKLTTDLISQPYTTDPKSRSIRMIGKEDLRALSIESTDEADALCLTFAEEVSDTVRSAGGPHRREGATSTRHPFERLEVA